MNKGVQYEKGKMKIFESLPVYVQKQKISL
jgi:hypothetical protein